MTTWVSLHEIYDWRGPNDRAMKSFPPGEHFVTEDQAADIERQGKGKRIERPDDKKTSKAGQTTHARR